jgi:hypothetical protein
VSDVILSNIQEWRRKAAAGEMTTEDYRLAIAAIRKERVDSHEKSAASKVRKTTAKAKAAPIDSDAMLGELGL